MMKKAFIAFLAVAMLCTACGGPATAPATTEPSSQPASTDPVTQPITQEPVPVYTDKTLSMTASFWDDLGNFGQSYQDYLVYNEDGTMKIQGTIGSLLTVSNPEVNSSYVELGAKFYFKGTDRNFLFNTHHASEGGGCGIGCNSYTYIFNISNKEISLEVVRFTQTDSTVISPKVTKEYTMGEVYNTFRVLTLTTDEGVRLFCSVNGIVLCDVLDDSPKAIREEGYFQFQGTEELILYPLPGEDTLVQADPLPAEMSQGFTKLSSEDKQFYAALEGVTPFIVPFEYKTGEVCVASANVVAYGAVGDGVTDDSVAFINAIRAVSKAGGGTVFVPNGVYYISQSLFIPSDVVLRGTYESPELTPQGGGSTLITDYAVTGKMNTPLIQLSNTSGIKNMAFYYVNQSFSDSLDLAPCIGLGTTMTSSTISKDLMIYNASYPLFFAAVHNGTHIWQNIWASPLKVGFHTDNSGDNNRMIHCIFDTDYYGECGFYGAPKTDADLAAYAKTMENALGYVCERNDALFLYDVESHGLGTALTIRKTSIPENNTWAGLGGAMVYKFRFTGCHTGLLLEDVTYNGSQLENGYIEVVNAPDSAGIRFTQKYFTNVFLNGITVTGSPEYGILGKFGNANIQAMNCSFDGWTKNAVSVIGGNTYLEQCQFLQKGNEILVGTSAAKGLSVLGCTFASAEPEIDIPDGFDSKLYVNSKAIIDQKLLRYEDYEFVDAYPSASAKKLYLLADYGVDKTGQEDVTEALQKALNDASKTGGIVLVQPGKYCLRGTVTVPTGVELRGVSEAATQNYSYCTMFFVYSGKGDESAPSVISLEKGAGIRGLQFFYPEQKSNNDYIPYPYTIKALGPDCWLVDVLVVNSYNLADFGSAEDTSNFFISGARGQSLKVGIFAGNNSGTGRIEFSHLHPGYWSGGITPNRPNVSTNGVGGGDASGLGDNPWTHFLQNLMEENTFFLLGDNQNLQMLMNAGFGSKYNMKFISQGKGGTQKLTAVINGTDASEVGYRIEAGGELNFYGSGICCVGSLDPMTYVEMIKGCGDTVATFNTLGCHGQNNTGFLVEDGTIRLIATNLFDPGDPVVHAKGGVTEFYFGRFAQANRTHVLGEAGAKVLLSGTMIYTPGALHNGAQIKVEGDAEVEINACPATPNPYV